MIFNKTGYKMTTQQLWTINQIQQQLFQIIKNKIPPEASVADEVVNF